MKTITEFKINKARAFVDRLIKMHKSPVISWSGGKDSMVLLHLIREMGYKHLPVYIWKEPWQPSKYEFHNRIISEWNLLCHTWNPSHSAFQQEGDEFELQNEYIFGNTKITCPSGITEIEPDMPWACSIDMLKRPKQPGLVVDWDVVFIGHKRCDTDPILGNDVGTRVDAKFGNHATLAFPLKDWSHDEIWDYTEKFNVPYDEGRYEKVNETWREKPDKKKNVDYVHACTNCIDRRIEPHTRVYCPKVDGIIENVSDKVPWYHFQAPHQYMKD